jgi:hypothetical protein
MAAACLIFLSSGLALAQSQAQAQAQPKDEEAGQALEEPARERVPKDCQGLADVQISQICEIARNNAITYGSAKMAAVLASLEATAANCSYRENERFGQMRKAFLDGADEKSVKVYEFLKTQFSERKEKISKKNCQDFYAQNGPKSDGGGFFE